MENEFKLDGKILCIDEKRPSKEGSSMMLQDFFIKQQIGHQSNEIKCQCVNNNCQLLDDKLPGDKVIITLTIQGSFKGAAYKEGHPKTKRNPEGLTGFSPNINVYEMEFQQGFVRSNPNQVQGAQGNPNQAQGNPNSNPKPGDTKLMPDGKTGQWNGSAWIVDDLPF